MQKYFKPHIIVKSFQSYEASVRRQTLISHFRVLNWSCLGFLARQRNVVKPYFFTQSFELPNLYRVVN